MWATVSHPLSLKLAIHMRLLSANSFITQLIYINMYIFKLIQKNKMLPKLLLLIFHRILRIRHLESNMLSASFTQHQSQGPPYT